MYIKEARAPITMPRPVRKRMFAAFAWSHLLVKEMTEKKRQKND